MASPSKRKGDRAELEVQGLLRDLLGVPARRALGAGRKDDVGDIHGVPNTVVQVVNRANLARGIREKLPESERQRENAGVDFAATFVRLPGGRFVVALTPEQWAMYWREAVATDYPDTGDGIAAFIQDMGACVDCPYPDGCPIGARECEEKAA